MRVLGIDYGRRRFGLALSDEERVLASPLQVYVRCGIDRDMLFICDLVESRDIGLIVLGMPRDMSGSLGEMAEEVTDFSRLLKERTRLRVATFDERLTTVEAERVLVQAGISRKRRKSLRDSLAAVLILQGYLDSSKG